MRSKSKTATAEADLPVPVPTSEPDGPVSDFPPPTIDQIPEETPWPDEQREAERNRANG